MNRWDEKMRNVYHIIWSNDVRVMRYQVRQTDVFVNLGYFLPFYLTNNMKNQNFEKIKKVLGDIIILKWNSYDMWFLWYGAWQTEIFVILDYFLPFYLFPQIYEKNSWRHYHFTHVNRKWKPYDVWYLRYGLGQTDFFSFWTIFCLFTPLTTHKIKIFNKWKKSLEIY